MKKFDQYVSHLRILSRAFDEDLTNDFIVSGIIDKYYIQFELGWKVLKELLRYEGANQAATGSPREIIKTAYAYYDFIDESVWLGIIIGYVCGIRHVVYIMRLRSIFLPLRITIKVEIDFLICQER